MNDFHHELNVLNGLSKFLSANKEVLNRYNISFDAQTVYAKQRAELSIEFGIDLAHKYGYDCLALDHDIYLHFMDGKQRSIPWSDDGRQPDNEWLLKISFPSGAYTLDRDYPVSLFQEMFLELKSFEPKYCDTANKSLYFDSTNAKVVYDAFSGILMKYKRRVGEWKKEDRVKKLKEELAKLEANNG